MRRKVQRGAAQLSLESAWRSDGRHGGWRPGAGRPRGRTTVAHEVREKAPASCPQHVTLRAREDVPSLRQPQVLYAVHASIRGAQRADFRVVHFSVQATHLHLIVEATSEQARVRGLQGLSVRLAHTINRALGRRGKLFDERYHARALRTPRAVRNAIRYVLNNARHHVRGDNPHLDASWIDPYSSAVWFDGWKEPVVIDHWSIFHVAQQPIPTAHPKSWLLTTGWCRHGLLRFDEIPGDSAASARQDRRSAHVRRP